MKIFYWIIFIWFFLSSCGVRTRAADVALYSDRGASDGCVTATRNMFEWMGLDVELIDADYVNGGSLSDFRIICFPGGNMYYYAQDITESGKDKIREFISDGGGYVGICGGAYFTGKRVFWQGAQLLMSPLGIFPGTTDGPIDAIAPYPDCVMCKINITERSHAITQSEPDSAWIMYCYGPVLLPESTAAVTILGTYDIVDQPAMIAFEYGNGRVFIIGTHPEFEEDSERDGVTFGDGFDDRGSDWDLMKKAAMWCGGEGFNE
ncbi:hypothetical protein AMJ87_00755 [candidate division WOR_3 bacterium SM23_60]|uniref:Biotin-protein ligase N-terminal domain-containing protein n=1 Tax=candidate division WOR_3 bacterium SM23_60 TaxID=1703780 RepID=A0A0S8GNB1_UNCW3|nr:MAG: hypothetical protein AMJ87_00755 [candidate division WOR_3 bacterium SM23_60]